jgi:hypothetical protein
MLKIEIASEELDVQSGTAKSGRLYSIRKQQGYAHLPSARYPSPFTLVLEKNQPPFAPGHYMLCDESFYVGEFGRLMVGKLTLKPIPVASVKPAA